MAAKAKTFEELMGELEEITEKLEEGDVTLDDSIKLFDKGMKLAATCGKRLEEAEKKVKILTADADGNMTEQNFGGMENE